MQFKNKYTCTFRYFYKALIIRNNKTKVLIMYFKNNNYYEKKITES